MSSKFTHQIQNYYPFPLLIKGLKSFTSFGGVPERRGGDPGYEFGVKS